jgi:CBS-domain-containing membrane protein
MHLKTDAVEELEIRRKILHSETVIDIIGRHRGDSKLLVVKKKNLVFEALILFGAGVQRVCVVNKSKGIVGILSQSKVLAWIAEDTRRLGELENEEASHLGTPWHRVVKISKDAITIEAVELMHSGGVFSLPLINDDGDLVGHVSMSDFKYLIIEDENFGDLLLPLEDFVAKRVESHSHHQPHNIVSAPVGSTMKEIVLTLFKEQHVHQLYLLDSEGQPKYFVSMTDVCHRIFTNNPIDHDKPRRQSISTDAPFRAYNTMDSFTSFSTANSNFGSVPKGGMPRTSTISVPFPRPPSFTLRRGSK